MSHGSCSSAGKRGGSHVPVQSLEILLSFKNDVLGCPLEHPQPGVSGGAGAALGPQPGVLAGGRGCFAALRDSVLQQILLKFGSELALLALACLISEPYSTGCLSSLEALRYQTGLQRF